jgi:UV DNA damage endonuclease
MVGPLDVDVMLEAKAKDLALLRLRKDLGRYAEKSVACLFGVETLADLKEAEEAEIEIDPAELESA